MDSEAPTMFNFGFCLRNPSVMPRLISRSSSGCKRTLRRGKMAMDFTKPACRDGSTNVFTEAELKTRFGPVLQAMPNASTRAKDAANRVLGLLSSKLFITAMLLLHVYQGQ